MDKIVEIAKSGYMFFTIISVVLILALVGYLVEKFSSKDMRFKNAKQKGKMDMTAPSISQEPIDTL